MNTDRRRAPTTAEGWYALHDFRRVDWDAWREASARRRERAIEEGIEYLSACERVDDADAGGSVTAAVLGHKADLCFFHLRPSMADLEALEREFERTALAEFTERADSYVSVTEVSGYLSEEHVEARARGEEADADLDPGLERYIQARLEPQIPDAEYVTFYPMDKRRDPEYNWYDLPFDRRAEFMQGHGDIGREYAGRVSQIITGSVGLDDHEWGVTLFADDPTDVKELLYEMRFDPSTSYFAEFGTFFVGRRFSPTNLEAYLEGEALATEDALAAEAVEEPAGGRPEGESPAEDVRTALTEQGVYAGKPHGEDVYAVVLYSTANGDELFEAVEGLRSNFDHYDTHVKTAVYASDEAGESAIVSVWETERAADTAAGFLAELPDVVRQAGDDGSGDSWGTMGMFYTVKPEHRDDFVETFDAVGAVLEGMDGHIQTDLLANREDGDDMFIASRWESKTDAMQFFRSDEFGDTVEWGRDVLADRPRHVFLA